MAEGSRLGEWSFIVGTVIAVLIGLFSGSLGEGTKGWLVLLLVVFGLVVGFLNITEKETTPFLVAGIALIATGTAGNTLSVIPVVGAYVSGVVSAIAVFVAPAAIIVALKAIRSLARN